MPASKDAGDPQLARGDPDRADRGVAVTLGLCFFLFYLLLWPGHVFGTDEVTVYETARALWERGDLAIPDAGPHVFRGRDGRPYGHFAIGQSVLLLPWYGLGKLALAALPEAWLPGFAGRARPPAGGSVEIAATTLYAPFASAVLVAIFFVFERRLGASLRGALLASLLLGAATYAATMSKFLLRHTSEAILILAAMLCWLRFHKTASLRALLAGSCAASLLVLVSVPATLAGPALAGYLGWALWLRRDSLRSHPALLARTALAIGLPPAVAIGVHMMLNHWLWGRWLESPMVAQRTLFETPFYVGAFGHLLSPGGSVFLYSPILLLAPWTFAGFWRTHRAELLTMIAVALTFFVVHSTFWSWTGLWSAPGPRYLLLVVPLFMLPLGPWLDCLRSVRGWAAVAVLGTAGAWIQLVLMAAPWGSVIRSMEYEKWEAPRYEFMFIPDQSPIVGSARALAAGYLAPWICALARGWPGFAPRPGPALLIFVAWAVCFGLALALLARRVRRHPAP
jgi:hypothetical protein